MNQTLNGKTALITGAATRVGASIAKHLHAAGAHVIIHYRQSATHAKELQEKFLAIREDSASLVSADLLHLDKFDGFARDVMACTGHLDLLVNNASTYYPTPLKEASFEQWNDLFGTNAKAPFFLAKAFADELTRQEGVIINLVDIHADRPNKNHPIYTMAKAANAMMVKTLARELAPGVRVNGVAPGAILWPDDHFSDTSRQKILERIPLNRPGIPDDVARTVLFLAESSYITGQIIAVDGGRSVQQ